MTDHEITTILAQRIMGWRVGPDRFLLGDRRCSHWQFQPIQRIADAHRLLERAAPEEYTMSAEKGGFRAEVRITGVTGEARESSQARALTFAIARAMVSRWTPRDELCLQDGGPRSGPSSAFRLSC